MLTWVLGLKERYYTVISYFLVFVGITFTSLITLRSEEAHALTKVNVVTYRLVREKKRMCFISNMK